MLCYKGHTELVVGGTHDQSVSIYCWYCTVLLHWILERPMIRSLFIASIMAASK